MQLRANGVPRFGASDLSESVDVNHVRCPPHSQQRRCFATPTTRCSPSSVSTREQRRATWAIPPRAETPRTTPPSTGRFEISPLFGGGGPGVDPSRPINVASGGNQQICRRVTPGEKQYKKETPGGRGWGDRRPHRTPRSPVGADAVHRTPDSCYKEAGACAHCRRGFRIPDDCVGDPSTRRRAIKEAKTSTQIPAARFPPDKSATSLEVSRSRQVTARRWREEPPH